MYVDHETIDQRLSRGSRPSPAKLATLAGQSYTATINLCAEMDGGGSHSLTASERDDSIAEAAAASG